MDKLTWEDQPKELEKAERKISVAKKGGGVVEVRALPEPDVHDEMARNLLQTFYVTVGSLWGSQTVRAHGVDAMFRALDLALGTPSDSDVEVPDGCSILENEERATA